MKENATLGSWILFELVYRIDEVTPDRFRAPDMAKPKYLRVLGEATDYQKALVTLRDELYAEHERLHMAANLPFGGNTDLPAEHQFLHAAPEILEAMLTTDLANTFRELSAKVSYFITANWKVCVDKGPIRTPTPKYGSRAN